MQREHHDEVAPAAPSPYRRTMATASWWWVVLGATLACGCEPTPISMHSHGPVAPDVPRPCRASVETRVVDLTHSLHDAMAYWPGGVPFKLTRLADYEEGYRHHKLEMGEGTGTHLDAPSHFIEGKRSVDQIPASELVVAAVVLDLRAKVKDDPDYAISANDIIDWEAIHGQVPVGALFIVNTGWHERFSKPDDYVNQDDEGVMHFPGFAKAAVQLLVERDVAGIGIDTLSVDPGASTDFAAHKVMLGANKYQLENLANLDALPETGATVVIGVLPVSEGTQAQARVLALVPEHSEHGAEGEEGAAHEHHEER